MHHPQAAITQALIEAYQGDNDAEERLWAMVYDALRQIAHRELQGMRKDHTLSTTALVHEVYLKLVDQTQITWRNRAHFYGLACRAMRNILVDYARRRNAQKRQGQKQVIALDQAVIMAEDRSEELIALDQALEHLAKRDPQLAQVVECRFFGGLTTKETAEVLEVSPRTVERLWNRAKTYLYLALHDE